jgi:hypothetical protein
MNEHGIFTREQVDEMIRTGGKAGNGKAYSTA